MFIYRRLGRSFYLSISIIIIILYIDDIRCECDFDDDSSNNYNSTESNEILVATYSENKDYADVSKPICSEPCENGCCIDTDTCLCHIGYQPSHVDKFDCEPICGDADIENTGCTNGVCIAPQVCECLDGFVLSRIQSFTCITDDDDDDEGDDDEGGDAGDDEDFDDNDDDNNAHEIRDTSYVFWILMSLVLLFIMVPIVALIVWAIFERKTTHIIDENENPTVVKYIVDKNNANNEVIICIKNCSRDCQFQICSPANSATS